MRNYLRRNNVSYTQQDEVHLKAPPAGEEKTPVYMGGHAHFVPHQTHEVIIVGPFPHSQSEYSWQTIDKHPQDI